MRQVLEFPKVDESKLETVKQLIKSIADNTTDAYSDAMIKLNSITGKVHEAMEFAEYWAWTDLDSLAWTAITPNPPFVSDLTKSDVIDVIAIIKESLITGDVGREEYYIELLHRSLPLANVTNYIWKQDSNEVIADQMMKAAKSDVIYL